MAFLSTLLTPVSTVIQGTLSFVTNTPCLSNLLLVKNAPGTLYTITGCTTSYNNQYIHVYNRASWPPGAVENPIAVFILPAQSNFNLDFGTGIPMSNGILICSSNTPTYYTSAGNNTFFTAVYK